MPSIPPDFLRAVAFLFIERPGGLGAIGTGFFVGQRETADGWRVWFLTARHVVRPFVEAGTRVLVRMDDVDPATGTTSYIVEASNWRFPDDPTIDLAWVAMAPPRDVVAYKVIPTSMLVRSSELETHGIGVADRVVLIGLLPQHVEDRNLPVVRHGHIAMLPTQPIRTEQGLAKVMLVEMTAYPGQSGSPVFGDLSIPDGVLNLRQRTPWWVIGVMHGYFPLDQPVFEVQTGTNLVTPVHVGICAVVPLDAFIDELPPGYVEPDVEPIAVATEGEASG